MSRPIYSANGMFLGVAEEEIKFKVDSHIMRAEINVARFIRESSPALSGEIRTEIYKKLLKGNEGYKSFGIMVELIFTNKQSWDKIGNKNSIELVKVLNLAKDRSERTILEVKVQGIEKSMVLKCVECEADDIKTGRVVTLAQKEIRAYDAIPDDLKDVFVEKYAHGRLWFDSSSYEVILMEQMSGPDLNHGLIQIKHKRDNVEQFVWLAKAIGLLHRIHVAGFSHGDAHVGNLMWSIGNGKGDLKFIDPERMVNMNVGKCDNAAKAIRKISDLANILFNNPMSIYKLSPSRGIGKINFTILHERLKRIRIELARQSQSIFFPFDETFPYDTLFVYAGIDDIDSITSRLKNANPSQYQKLNEAYFNDMFDNFTLALTDPLYAQRVFVYITDEINKSTKNDRISESDLNVPRQEAEITVTLPQSPIQQLPRPPSQIPPSGRVVANTPIQRPLRPPPQIPPTGYAVVQVPSRQPPRIPPPGHTAVYAPIQQPPQPRPRIPPPGHAVVYTPTHPPILVRPRTPTLIPANGHSGSGSVPRKPGVYPLKYMGRTIEGRTKEGVFYDIYYSLDREIGTSLMQYNYDIGDYEDILRYYMREMYVAQQQMIYPVNGKAGEKMFFKINRPGNELEVYRCAEQTVGEKYTLIERVKLIETPPQTAQTNSNSSNFEINPQTPSQKPPEMYKLEYTKQAIQAYDGASPVLYDIAYSVDKYEIMELFKFNRSTGQFNHMEGAVTRGMFTDGRPIISPIDNAKLYFVIDTHNKKMTIQRLDTASRMYINIDTVSL